MPMSPLRRSFYSLLASSLLAAAISAVPPSDYDLWTAVEKEAWMKANLDVGKGGSEHTAPFWDKNDHPDKQLNICMHEECTYPGGFNTHKDFVSPYECRAYAVHPTGLVAQVKAVWYPNPYTGMFQKADHGIARWGYQTLTPMMSQAQAVADTVHHLNLTLRPMEEGKDWSNADCFKYDCFNLSKGFRYNENSLEFGERPDTSQFMALKFFRDGVPSASIHTGFPGYPTWNHFSRTYTNLLMNFQDEQNDTALGGLSVQATERGTQWPGFTGLHDMAMYDEAGNLQQDINFPYQLIFLPATEEGVIPESVHGNYPRTVELADAWGPGTTLFHIMAKHSFAAPMVLIGRIELASKIMLSADSDRQVFFAHPRFDRDVVLRPELIEPPGCTNFWECETCPVIFELCSPTAEDLERWKRARSSRADRLAALRNRSLDRVPRWSCSGRPKAQPAAATAQPTASSLLQKGASLKRTRRGLKRRLQLQLDEEMRPDDLQVEPLSGMVHLKDWFCQQDPSSWPNAKRPEPWTSSCEATKLPDRYVSEPEWALPEGCADVPLCDRPSGMWYSSTYPCRCGSNTCASGQLCTALKDSCVAWGPYASPR